MNNKREINLTVTAEQSNQRLDKYLTNILKITRSQVNLHIKEKKISVNNKTINKSGYTVQSGDTITGLIDLLPELDDDIQPEDIPLDVIYEDDDLIVINKQTDLVVHPTDKIRTGTLVNGLIYKYKENLSNLDKFRPGIIHRLDKDTTGLIIIAKNNNAHNILSKQLETRSLTREYYALVTGKPKIQEGIINLPLARHLKDRKKMSVQQDAPLAKEAITHYKTLETSEARGKLVSLLRVSLKTGRTHQIRVHMHFRGHALIGDQLYTNQFNSSKLIKRQCLHAKKIQFIHPTTEKLMSFEIDLPDDFKEILEYYKIKDSDTK